MNADDLFQRFHGELIGRPITYVRLACNSLLLYVDCEPGDGQGLTLWFEPPWHVSTPAGVIAGSRQAQVQGDDGPTEAELDRVSGPIADALLGQLITSVEVDPRSRDLLVAVANTFYVRTFVSDPEDDHLWHIRENATGLKLVASHADWRVLFNKS